MPKIKVLIEIHQNTKLKGDQFHVVYNGGNYENTSSSEKLKTIASCKKNIKAHAKLFCDKFDPLHPSSLEHRGINVNVYKDKQLIKTIFLKF